jgi:hypothetical protein
MQPGIVAQQIAPEPIGRVAERPPRLKPGQQIAEPDRVVVFDVGNEPATREIEAGAERPLRSAHPVPSPNSLS